MKILDQIVATKKTEISSAKALMPLEQLTASIDSNRPRRSLISKLTADDDSFHIIAEIKKKSPSKGLIATVFNPADAGRQYEAAGASAVSVLTDSEYFGGCAGDLKSVRKAIDLPILRKDFIIDPYQLAEAAAWGADIILLIARILLPEEIAVLAGQARAYGLEILFEVHDAEDLRKLPEAGECILGINNRDLQTFNVSLSTTQSLMNSVPHNIPAISESGVFTPDDVRFLKSCGVRGALIGESFMKTSSPGKALKSLIDGYNG